MAQLMIRTAALSLVGYTLWFLASLHTLECDGRAPKPKYKVGTLLSCVPRVIPNNISLPLDIVDRQIMEIKGGDWSFGPQWYYDLILFNEENTRVAEIDP